MFGSVKIPRFEMLNSSLVDGGWKDVPLVLEPTDFTSVLGFPVTGPPLDIETQFNLESTYCTTKCEPFVQLPYSLNATRADLDRLSRRMRFNLSATAAAGLMPGRWLGPRRMQTFFIDTERQQDVGRANRYMGFDASFTTDSGPDTAEPRRLVVGSLYISRAGNAPVINLANCTVSETHVESVIHCAGNKHGGGCRARKQRLSLVDRRPPSLTAFDNWIYTERFTSNIARHTGTGSTSSLMEVYLSGSAMRKILRKTEDNMTTTFFDLHKVDPWAFSHRLGSVLTGYHHMLISLNAQNGQSTFEPYAANASVPVRDIGVFAKAPAPAIASTAAFAAYNSHVGRVIVQALLGGLPYIPAVTTAASITRTPIFVCQFAWFALLVLAAAAPLLAGAASLVLQLRCTLAPDMLRFAASMTYTNPYFSTPPGGTALEGMARTRLLRDVRVRIGDINGSGDVGAVAFVAADEVETRKLDPKRFYA